MRKLVLVACLLAIASAVAVARTGGWVDEIVFFVEEDQPKILSMMETGDAHLYANNFDGIHQPLIEEKGLPYKVAYGSSREILLNPEGPYFNDGRWNPFDDIIIQTALNKIIDRQYILDEWAFGLGVPMFSTLSPVDPVYAEIADVARANAIKFAYDEAGAIEMINERMPELGAELINGTWHHANQAGEMEEVVIIGLIRSEDVRTDIGNYFADQVEKAGFKVDRQYKKSAEASPLWISSPGEDGKFHFYTGGWGATGIDREYVWPYAGHYTDIGWPTPRTRGYPDEIDDEMYTAAVDIINGSYATVEERLQNFRICEAGVGKYPWHVWLHAEAGSWVVVEGLDVAADLMAGIAGSEMAPRTVRFVDADGAPIEGGTVRYANQSFLTQPWNAPHGSNWQYDAVIQRTTEDPPTLGNPYTGLAFPNFLEKATVTVKEGLPVRVTEDWCTLEFVPENVVPADAWSDWDATAGNFVTAGEKFPDGVSCDVKMTLTFPSELWTWKWHDGSNISMGDLLMGFIYGFPLAPAKEESPYYDADQVSQYEASMSVFRGIKVLTVDPLVYEIYFDGINLDAETIVQNNDESMWFRYAQGTAPWHTMALGLLAEEAGTGTFSSGKAEVLGVDRLNYVDGPQLADLVTYLGDAQVTNFLPFPNVFSQFVTTDEVVTRYANLANFYSQYGHMWIGTGPYFVESVDSLADIVVVKRYADYPFDLEKFLVFAEPKMADVDVTGPDTVAIGAEGVFDVSVTYAGEAYPLNELNILSYLIIDATGEIAFSGTGEFTADGQGTITVPADKTATLVEGSSTLEVVVTVLPVVIPATAATTFIAVQ